jgi:hypothetical protein
MPPSLPHILLLVEGGSDEDHIIVLNRNVPNDYTIEFTGDYEIGQGDLVYFVGAENATCPSNMAAARKVISVDSASMGILTGAFPKLEEYAEDSIRMCLQQVQDAGPVYFAHVGIDFISSPCEYYEGKNEEGCATGVSKGKCMGDDAKSFQFKCPVECGLCSFYPPWPPPPPWSPSI